MRGDDALCPDFDFAFGRWRVRHRRLRDRLTGCQDWDSFDGTSETRPVLGGAGNIEDNLLHLPSGPLRAIAVRSFDPVQRSWAIWWLASNDPHRLDTPVIGRFAGDSGVFLSHDTLRGQPIQVRFVWRVANPETPRWEQAFSADGGHEWETNWIMDFRRG